MDKLNIPKAKKEEEREEKKDDAKRRDAMSLSRMRAVVFTHTSWQERLQKEHGDKAAGEQQKVVASLERKKNRCKRSTTEVDDVKCQHCAWWYFAWEEAQATKTFVKGFLQCDHCNKWWCGQHTDHLTLHESKCGQQEQPPQPQPQPRRRQQQQQRQQQRQQHHHQQQQQQIETQASYTLPDDGDADNNINDDDGDEKTGDQEVKRRRRAKPAQAAAKAKNTKK